MFCLPPHALRRVTIAVASTLAALALTFALQPFVTHMPYLLFITAVIISAIYGGLLGGLLSSALAVIATWLFFIEPTNSVVVVDMNEILQTLVFLLVAVFISGLTHQRRDVERALYESNQTLNALVKASPLALMLLDMNGSVRLWNPAAERILGWRADEVLGKLLPAVPAHKREEFEGHLKVISGGQTIDGQETQRHKKATASGIETIPVRLWAAPLRDGHGDVRCMTILDDISEPKRIEQQSAQRLRQLEYLYRLTDTLNRAQDMPVIYDSALEGLIRSVGVARASILLFDADGVMRFKAWRGLSDEYRSSIEGHSSWSRDAQDPQPVCINDVMLDNSLGELRNTILAEGIRALAFIPLTHQGHLLGKFMLYCNAPHVFTAEELHLAQTIVSQVAFAIERARAQAELRNSRDQLSVILAGISDGISVVNPAGKFIYVNDAAARLSGFESAQQMLSTRADDALFRFVVRDEHDNPLPLRQLPGRRALHGESVGDTLLRFIPFHQSCLTTKPA